METQKAFDRNSCPWQVEQQRQQQIERVRCTRSHYCLHVLRWHEIIRISLHISVAACACRLLFFSFTLHRQRHDRHALAWNHPTDAYIKAYKIHTHTHFRWEISSGIGKNNKSDACIHLHMAWIWHGASLAESTQQREREEKNWLDVKTD